MTMINGIKKDITYFARVNFRDDNRLFGIHQADRLLHTYLLGKTGTGKSTCLKTMILQDINSGRGCCLLDPHNDLVEDIYQKIPDNRKDDVIYIDITDPNLNIRYNPFKRVSESKRSLVGSGILEVFSKLWGSAWGAKLEHILRFVILTLLCQPNASVEDIPELLLNKSFRRKALSNVEDETIIKFWKREFPEYNKYDLLPVMNKVGSILVHPLIRNILFRNPNEISLRKAMDEKKIILVNLSKGHVGSDVSHVLGALFVTSLASASFSRADTPEDKRVPFMIYMDEFQNFTTLSLVNMFSELRKFKVGMILAHQYLNQLKDSIKSAVLGNVGTIISFRVGIEDAKTMAGEMFPVFEPQHFVSLSNYDIYLKLMINGSPCKPFSATTISDPPRLPNCQYLPSTRNK